MKMNGNKTNKGKGFTSTNQPTPEQKKAGWDRKKALDELKEQIVEKSFKKIFELLEKDEISNQDLRDIFKTAVDMSGYKKQTQEIDTNGINVIIKEEYI